MLELLSVKESLEQDNFIVPEPIVSGWIFRDTLVVLGAPENSFKTTLSIQLSICLAAGIPFFNFQCKSCIVVYLVLEGGKGYMLERIEEMVNAMGLDNNLVLSRIYIEEFSSSQLNDEAFVRNTGAALMKLDQKPDFIVFDPVTYALSEDVRYSPTMTMLAGNMIQLAKSINGVSMVILHCRKGATDDDNMDDLLGSSVLADAAATRIKLYRKGDDLHVFSKTRYAETPETINLCFRHPILTIAPEQLKPREESRRVVLKILEQCQDQKKHLAELVEEAKQKTSHNPKTIRAAIEDLETKGTLQLCKIPHSALKYAKLVPGAGASNN